jgi:hypothetical protein
VRTGEVRNVFKILAGKFEEKRPLGRAWRRWVDNIKMDISEIGMESLGWIHLALDRDR